MNSQRQMVVSRIRIPVLGPIICLICYFVYILAHLERQFNFMNVLSFMFSVELIFIGLSDLKSNGIKLHNTFILTYFICLALNNLNISTLQKPKTFVDLYYFFVGPLAFTLVLYIGRKPSRYKLRKFHCLNANNMAVVLLLLLLILKIMLIYKTGIRFLSDDWKTSDASKYVVSGLSGLSQMCMWVLLMMVPVIDKRLKIMSVLTILINVVLNAGRGDIMRVIIYLIIMWASFFGKRFITKKNILCAIIIFLVIVIFFSTWGNYRQFKRGWTGKLSFIGTYFKSHSNNDIINWLFSYTAFNFDVLKHINIDGKFAGDISIFFLPIIRIIEGGEAVDRIANFAASGFYVAFNASTFLSDFISVMGYMYFIGLILLGIFVVILDKMCLIEKFVGGHIFLIMLTALSIFGNYYLQVNLFYSLVAGILLYYFIDDKPKSNYQANN